MDSGLSLETLEGFLGALGRSLRILGVSLWGSRWTLVGLLGALGVDPGGLKGVPWVAVNISES